MNDDTKCDYCNTKKKNHDNNHTYSTRRHVSYKGDKISMMKGTVHFLGMCDRKARKDEKWEL